MLILFTILALRCRVAGCLNVLQGVAGCCRVLQCVAVPMSFKIRVTRRVAYRKSVIFFNCNIKKTIFSINTLFYLISGNKY